VIDRRYRPPADCRDKTEQFVKIDISEIKHHWSVCHNAWN